MCRRPTVTGIKHELKEPDPLEALGDDPAAAGVDDEDAAPADDADAPAKTLVQARAALATVQRASRVTCAVDLIQRLQADAVAQHQQQELGGQAAFVPPKFVLFTTLPQLLRQMATALAAAQLPYFTIEGGTPMPERAKNVKAFQDPQDAKCVALLSSRAGSAGLTLTAANHLIFLEPMTNVGQAEQAAARIHRFGQSRPVTIHRLLADDTVDTRLQGLLDSGTLTAQGLDRFAALSPEQRADVVPQLGHLLARHPLPPAQP